SSDLSSSAAVDSTFSTIWPVEPSSAWPAAASLWGSRELSEEVASLLMASIEPYRRRPRRQVRGCGRCGMAHPAPAARGISPAHADGGPGGTGREGPPSVDPW